MLAAEFQLLTYRFVEILKQTLLVMKNDLFIVYLML